MPGLSLLDASSTAPPSPPKLLQLKVSPDIAKCAWGHKITPSGNYWSDRIPLAACGDHRLGISR